MTQNEAKHFFYYFGMELGKTILSKCPCPGVGIQQLGIYANEGIRIDFESTIPWSERISQDELQIKIEEYANGSDAEKTIAILIPLNGLVISESESRDIIFENEGKPFMVNRHMKSEPKLSYNRVRFEKGSFDIDVVKRFVAYSQYFIDYQLRLSSQDSKLDDRITELQNLLYKK